jgi:predicted Zn finger-like uncharacterized protein
MIVTCPSCLTEFRIPPSIASADRPRLKCSKCAHVWRYQPPHSEPESFAAAEETPAFLHDSSSLPQLDSFAKVLNKTAAQQGARLAEKVPRKPWFRFDGQGIYGYGMAIALVALILGGYYVFSYRPHHGVPPLLIEQVTMRRLEAADGTVKIRIDAELPNRGTKIEPILPVKVRLLGDTDKDVVAIWVFQPTIRNLSPGSVARFFTSRKVDKPDDVKRVELRFFIPAAGA